MNSLLLAAALAVAPTAPTADSTTTEACPAPVITVPRYPAKELMNNIGGTAVVLANIDACGRVLSPRIVTSSGHRALDEEALVTVSHWVLTPAQRALAKGGVLKLPVKFGGVQSAPLQVTALQWPKSHRRPQYEADETFIGFDSIESFLDDASVRAKGNYKTPYASAFDGRGGRISTIFAPDASKPDVFWLTYSLGDDPSSMPAGAPRREARTLGVARYRLVLEGGKPVVSVALLCEAEPDACAQLKQFLLKGLPIAPPPRR